MVKKGQNVAIQRDLFDGVIKGYEAPHDGYVLSRASDPVREPGAMLVRVLRFNTHPRCADGC